MELRHKALHLADYGHTGKLGEHLSLDYSQIELRVFAELASQGRFDNMEPKRNFSKIYGINREELTEGMTDRQKREVTLAFIQKFPGAFQYIPGLRKAKTKMMVNALMHGHADNGNHFVTCYGFDYHFFYRGTQIYRWDALRDIGQEVSAGRYNDTASTRNQRKEIMKAIENFKEAVYNL